jgi:murein DD-endopeptidase MepM/ murein hydrolase activator NlpD
MRSVVQYRRTRAGSFRRLRAAFLLTVLPLLLAGLVGGELSPAQAGVDDRKKRVDRKIGDLKHELNETSKELRQAAAALDRAERKLPGAKARVSRVSGKLAAEQAKDRMIGEQLQVAKAEVKRAKREIRGTMREIADSQELIGRIASSSYQSGGMGELAVILDSETPEDFADRLVLVQNALASEGETLGNLAEARADLAAQRATLVAKKQQVAEMKREQEAVVARVTELKAQAVEAQQAVEQLIAERESAVAAVEREKAKEEARYEEMRRESQRLGAILKKRAERARRAAARRAARSSSGGGGGLSWPVYGPITSSYGMRTHPVTGIYKLHDGTDFGVGCGTPVHAAASGTVIQAANVPGYGNQLVIDHGIERGVGLGTSYSHLMSFNRGYGSHVARGDVIGYSGGGEGMYGAGYSTGCHLHFMVYVNGGTTNPLGWL